MSFRLLVYMILVFSSMSFLYAEENDTLHEAYINLDFNNSMAHREHFTIVILPIQNATAFPELPYYFRMRLAEQFRAKGYSIVTFDVIDQFLINEGVQSTDQLGLIDYELLANATSADAILSGIIETATLQNAALYSGFAFAGSLKLQDREKNLLWYNLSQRVAKRRVAIDPVNILLNTLMDSSDAAPVKAIEAVADKLLEDFPDGPISVEIDNLLEQAVELK
ncbi:MAG: hypothetical protein JXK05_08155 [Campylobacterales bacterium]|nr:hypothetical protein [Campylobacterales bacterium]